MRESYTDGRRNKSWPDLLCLGQVGLNFLLNDSGFGGARFHKYFKRKPCHMSLLEYTKFERMYPGCWGLVSWHNLCVLCPILYQMFRAQVGSASKTGSGVQRFFSQYPISYHPSLATLTLFISALHQCPVCLCAIGQSWPHGVLISLTSSIDPHYEMVQGFDLSEPIQILT